MSEGKTHLSVVICGHVDAGKSTTTGRLIFELGGISERDIEKLKAEADALGKSSFAFAFYMDRQKEERERGVTIACTTKEFFTTTYHYTVIGKPHVLCLGSCSPRPTTHTSVLSWGQPCQRCPCALAYLFISVSNGSDTCSE